MSCMNFCSEISCKEQNNEWHRASLFIDRDQLHYTQMQLCFVKAAFAQNAIDQSMY
jgi:hypothetical protein